MEEEETLTIHIKGLTLKDLDNCNYEEESVEKLVEFACDRKQRIPDFDCGESANNDTKKNIDKKQKRKRSTLKYYTKKSHLSLKSKKIKK